MSDKKPILDKIFRARIELRKTIEDTEGPLTKKYLDFHRRQTEGSDTSMVLNEPPTIDWKPTDEGYIPRLVPRTRPFTWKTEFPEIPGMDNELTRTIRDLSTRGGAVNRTTEELGSKAWQDVLETAAHCLNNWIFRRELMQTEDKNVEKGHHYKVDIYNSKKLSYEEKAQAQRNINDILRDTNRVDRRRVREIWDKGDKDVKSKWKVWLSQNSNIPLNLECPTVKVLLSLKGEPAPEFVSTADKACPDLDRRISSELVSLENSTVEGTTQRMKELMTMRGMRNLVKSLNEAYTGQQNTEVEQSSESDEDPMDIDLDMSFPRRKNRTFDNTENGRTNTDRSADAGPASELRRSARLAQNTASRK